MGFITYKALGSLTTTANFCGVILQGVLSHYLICYEVIKCLYVSKADYHTLTLHKCSDPLLELHYGAASAKRRSGNHKGYRGFNWHSFEARKWDYM